MTRAHLGEGIGDEFWFWKVIGMPEDVRESGWIGGKQSMAIDEATVGKGVAVLFCPGVRDVVVLLVGQLSQVSEKKGGGRRGWKQTKRGAETSEDDEDEGPEAVKGEGGGGEEERGKEREWHRRFLSSLCLLI